MQKDKISIGYMEAAQIIEKRAKLFSYAVHVLPKEERQAADVVYAVCRITEDTFDKPGETGIESLKRTIDICFGERELHDPLLLAFRDAVTRYRIPKIYFDELIDGMMMDMTKTRYKDFEELYTYCYRVAGILGLMMNRILGGDTKNDKYAEKLGIAMQLTNILRDIREDWAAGRVYLPQDEMAQLNVSENSLARWRTDNNFKELIKFQIDRARKYYREAEGGIAYFKDKRSRMAVQLLKEAYGAILDDIEKHGCNVFSRRAYVPFFKKLRILFRVMLRQGKT